MLIAGEGFSGWISFDGTNKYDDGTEYKYGVKKLGVSSEPNTSCNFDGYAWGGNEIGWLDVFPSNQDSFYSLKLNENSGCKSPNISNLRTEDGKYVVESKDGIKLEWDTNNPGNVHYYELEAELLSDPLKIMDSNVDKGDLISSDGDVDDGNNTNKVKIDFGTEFTVKPINLASGRIRYKITAYNKFGDKVESNTIDINSNYQLKVNAFSNTRSISNRRKLDLYVSLENYPLQAGNYAIEICKVGTGTLKPDGNIDISCKPILNEGGTDRYPILNYQINEYINPVTGDFTLPNICPNSLGCQNLTANPVIPSPITPITPPALVELFIPESNREDLLLEGWLWSDNIGWISLKGNNYGIGFEMNRVDGVYTEGYIKDSGVTRYAWSDTVGWIDFRPDAPYPNYQGSTQDKIKYSNTTKSITGFAKVLVESTGLEPWISFDGTNTYQDGTEYKYGVKKLEVSNQGNQTELSCNFDGYAWGSDFTGWIDVSPSTYDTGTDDTSFYNMKVINTNKCKKMDDINLISNTNTVTKSNDGVILEWNNINTNSEIAYYEVEVDRVELIQEIEDLPTGSDLKNCMIHHTRDGTGNLTGCHNSSNVKISKGEDNITLYPINLEGGRVYYKVNAYNKFGDKITSNIKEITSIYDLTGVSPTVDSEPIVFSNIPIPDNIDALDVFTINVLVEYIDNDPSNGISPKEMAGTSYTIRNLGKLKYKEISP